MQLFVHETKILQRLKHDGYVPNVIFDIGASNGVWSDTIALTLPEATYYLFEPLANAVPFYAEDLRERLSRRPNFHVLALALADHRGEIDMFVTHDGFGSSMLDRGAIPEVKRHVRVPLFTLDEFVRANDVPSPQVIKIDVQGAERLILAGSKRTLRETDVLFMETWLTRGYGPDTPLLTEMIEFLSPQGFTLVALGEQFRDDTGRIYSLDAVFFSGRMLAHVPRDESTN